MLLSIRITSNNITQIISMRTLHAHVFILWIMPITMKCLFKQLILPSFHILKYDLFFMFILVHLHSYHYPLVQCVLLQFCYSYYNRGGPHDTSRTWSTVTLQHNNHNKLLSMAALMHIHTWLTAIRPAVQVTRQEEGLWRKVFVLPHLMTVHNEGDWDPAGLVEKPSDKLQPGNERDAHDFQFFL